MVGSARTRLKVRNLRLGGDPDAQAGAGGPTVALIAGAALKHGDVVYVSAARTVNKAAVAANGAKFAGVVVGGGSDFGADQAEFETRFVGLAATAANKTAVVQVIGIANVVAGDAIVAGAQLGFDTTTAGRVLTNTTAGQIIGIALTAAAAAGNTIQMLISPR